MNRFLPAIALSFSLCALLATFFLWQEVGALRLETSQRPIHIRISDQQFAITKEFVAYIHTDFDKGFVVRSDVLKADQLLLKARYMHGDISEAEWHRQSFAMEPELTNLLIARLKEGAASIDDIILHYDGLLESSR